MLRALNIDEVHRTFDDFFAHQETLINGCQNIDECIADGQGIEAHAIDICEIYRWHAKS